MFYKLQDIAEAIALRVSNIEDSPFLRVSTASATDGAALLEHVKSVSLWPSATVLLGNGSFENGGNLRKFTVAIIAAAEFAAKDDRKASALWKAVDSLSDEFVAEPGTSPTLLDSLPCVVAMEPKGWSQAAADRLSAFTLEIELTEVQHTTTE